MDTQGDEWVVVYTSRFRGRGREHALVLAAMGIPHELVDGPYRSIQVRVPPTERDRALGQLRLYTRENRRPAFAPVPLHGHGVAGVVGYALVMIGCFLLQRRFAGGVDWLAAGGMDGIAVRAGQWWRVVTALTLHADGGHLLANLLFGAFFGLFAGQYLGSGVAWLVIGLAAAAGNAMDLLLLPPAHRAIGASTAVFAALGLVGAFVWVTHGRGAMGWARRLAPVIGAVVLLAWIGTGDENTDTVAHLTGFVAGFLAGAVLGWRPPGLLRSGRAQVTAGLLALAGITTCWWLAIAGWRAALA